MDKSATHIRVQKNGIEDWLPKNVWNAIGGNDNKDGWTEIQSTPPEVIEVRQMKKAEPKVEVIQKEVKSEPEKEELIDVVGAENEKPVKKVKPGKK